MVRVKNLEPDKSNSNSKEKEKEKKKEKEPKVVPAKVKIAKCIKEKDNWSKIDPEHRFDGKTFRAEQVLKDMAAASPKLAKLISTIEELDARDMQRDGRVYKHFIYSDIKSPYGAKLIASGLVAKGFKHAYGLKDSVNGRGRGGQTLGFNAFGPNTFATLTSTEIFSHAVGVQFRKNLLQEFNKRPENIYGENIRIIILDSGFREGVDLFDIKYVHLFEPILTRNDEKQAVGRATRFCGQKGLAFDSVHGWPLHVYRYQTMLSEQMKVVLKDNGQKVTDNVNSFFDMFLLYSNFNSSEIRLAGELERVAIKAAVDAPLTHAIHSFGLGQAQESQEGQEGQEEGQLGGVGWQLGGVDKSAAKDFKAKQEEAARMREIHKKFANAERLAAVFKREKPNIAEFIREKIDKIDRLVGECKRFADEIYDAERQVSRRVDEYPNLDKYASQITGYVKKTGPIMVEANQLSQDAHTQADIQRARLQTITYQEYIKLKDLLAGAEDQLQNKCLKSVLPMAIKANGIQETVADIVYYEEQRKAASLERRKQEQEEEERRARSLERRRVEEMERAARSIERRRVEEETRKALSLERRRLEEEDRKARSQERRDALSLERRRLEEEERAARELEKKRRLEEKLLEKRRQKEEERRAKREERQRRKEEERRVRSAERRKRDAEQFEIDRLLVRKKNHADMEKFIKKYYAKFAWPAGTIKNACVADVADVPVVGTVVDGSQLEFTPTQNFVRHYLNVDSEYHGLLAFHSVGTGKSCTAIATATTTFEPKGWTILYVTKHTLKPDIWKNMFDQVCSIVLREALAKAIPKDNAGRMKMLSKSWAIKPMSYRQFSNMLAGKSKLSRDLAAINGKKDPLHKTFIVIDEAHKLFAADVAASEKCDVNVIRKAIWNSYSESGKEAAKVLLMTGTPYTNRPVDMVKLLNLLRDKNDQLPDEFDKFGETYLRTDGTFSEDGEARFIEEVTGYISYLNRERDVSAFAYPIFHEVKVPMSMYEFSAELENLEKATLEVEKLTVEVNRIKDTTKDVLEEYKLGLERDQEAQGAAQGVAAVADKAQKKAAAAAVKEAVKVRKAEIGEEVKGVKERLREMKKEVTKEKHNLADARKNDRSQQTALEGCLAD